jgi:uncharacterized protein (DUF1330 family)
MENVRAIDPTREGFKQMFASVPADVPVHMLNLVRFHEKAQDPTGSHTRSGKQAYAKYLELFTPMMRAAGGRIAWMGTAHHTLIAPPGEIWDEIIVVEYPKIDTFAKLIRSAEYKAILHHRLAGVSDTRLVVATPTSP